MTGRIVLITGAGSGIGAVMAGQFAAQGDRVVVVDINGGDAAAVVAALPGATAVTVDVTSREQVRAAVARIEQDLGPVDVLVNNAGVASDVPFGELPEELWHRDIAVSLDGAFHTISAVLPAMIAARSGVIVNITSVNGLTYVGNEAYSAAKAGLISLTKSIAVRYGAHGIRCKRSRSRHHRDGDLGRAPAGGSPGPHPRGQVVSVGSGWHPGGRRVRGAVPGRAGRLVDHRCHPAGRWWPARRTAADGRRDHRWREPAGAHGGGPVVIVTDPPGVGDGNGVNRTVLRGGTVVDGSGRSPRRADVAVDGPLITAVGEISASADDVVLDCSERLVMPGFIDAHSHAEATIFDPEIGFALLRQGITTVIGGQDGVGFAPGDGRYAGEYFAALGGEHPTYTGGGVGALLDTYAGRVAVNVGYLVPHGTVRHEVMGDDDRPPTTGELEDMTALVRLGLTEGALGLSTGLDYAPGYFADTDELIALNRPVAQVGATYVSHMRGGYEENTAFGIDEVVRIALATHVSAHISHLHGPAALVTRCLSQAAVAGADLSFDAYPYRRGCTLLAMPMVPPALLRLGAHAAAERLADPQCRAEIARDWLPLMESRPGFGPSWAEGITLAGVAAPEHRWAEGLTLARAAERAGTEPGEFGLRLIAASRLAVSAVLKVPDQRSLDELAAIFTHPAHVASTDGIYLGGHPHPRGWGTFARYLALYTRQRGDYSWEQAARHLSGRTAERHGLGDRGAVAPGRAADLIVVDPETVTDPADYDYPRLPAVGIDDVLVNGIVVLRTGRPTGDLPGKGLRRSAKVVRTASEVMGMPAPAREETG